jgi:hypothetical protein
MLESLLVGVIVVAAAAYAAWAFTPAVTRNRLATRAAAALGGQDASGLRGWLATHLRRIGATAAGGCSACASNLQTPAERTARGDRR